MTKIEWTEKTWNPIIGCTKISEGCNNCYAEKMAQRLTYIKSTDYYSQVVKYENVSGGGEFEDPDQWITLGWNNKTYFVESALEKPLKWKKPKMIFVCSMGDLFHESVPFKWIDKVMAVIGRSQQHTFQILTKRPERMKQYFNEGRYDEILRIAQNLDFYAEGLGSGISNPKDMSWWKNVWLGVTAENQQRANERIPVLLDIPAAKRFVSCEPLLSDIDLQDIQPYGRTLDDWDNKSAGIHWVIAGPETGSKSRPMKKEWIENIYNQCKDTNVPFFDKKDTLGLGLKQLPL